MPMRFWACDNLSKCPWSVQPFETRPPAHLKCGNCLLARYCSRECQKTDWPKHKIICRDLEKIRLHAEIASNSKTSALESEKAYEEIEQGSRQQLQELATSRLAPGLSREVVAKIKRLERKARDHLKKAEKGIEINRDLVVSYNEEEEKEAQLDAFVVVFKAIPKFMNDFGAVMKSRALQLGKWLGAQNKCKGAISMEFGSKAAISYATRWLDQKQSAVEDKDRMGEDREAFDPADPMMKQLFLVGEIKGLTQLKYHTLSEAKDEAVKEASLLASPDAHLTFFPGV